jgi:5'-nucleotidase
MFSAPLDLKNTRILVTNDDGIRSTGLKVLERVARSLSKDVWVVAPEQEQSAVSHSLTIRMPLRIRRIKRTVFAVDGTPTDCVLLAINHILKDHKPTLCLSGVNRGGNLGEDVTYSGTIAAAMEATLLGVPAMAFSQVYDAAPRVPWSTAETHAGTVIKRMTGIGWPRNTLVNVNFPNRPADEVKEIVAVKQGRHKIGDQLVEHIDPRGVPYYWIGAMRTEDPTQAGTDIATVNEGKISVTPLHLDLTHQPTLRAFRDALAPRR